MRPFREIRNVERLVLCPLFQPFPPTIVQPISPEESMAMDKMIQDSGFKLEETLWTAGGWSMSFSILIWITLHDQIEELRRIQPFQGAVDFNLQAGDLPVWGIPNMLLKQQSTTTSYVGGYSGASIRVASGLYYRFGGVRGHRVESTSWQEIEYGDFLMTTRAIYFGGSANGINFRLPYRQIIRFQPYADAVGVCRNAPESRSLFQSGHTLLLGRRSVATLIDHGWEFCFQIVARLQSRFQIAAGF
jgi:hypothetical protein